MGRSSHTEWLILRNRVTPPKISKGSLVRECPQNPIIAKVVNCHYTLPGVLLVNPPGLNASWTETRSKNCEVTTCHCWTTTSQVLAWNSFSINSHPFCQFRLGTYLEVKPCLSDTVPRVGQRGTSLPPGTFGMAFALPWRQGNHFL